MKVLSLFDGISCGMVALERAGIPVERYVAYEIEPNAIKISKKTIHRLNIVGMLQQQISHSIKVLICLLVEVLAQIGLVIKIIMQK